jgi:hypothetical protein
MNKETFLAQVEEQTSKFQPKQKEIIKEMVEKLLTINHGYENPIYYSKKVKDKDEQPPLNLYTVGVKERSLSFHRYTLNLTTNAVEGVKSVLKEEAHFIEPLVDPEGEEFLFRACEHKYTIQEKL